MTKFWRLAVSFLLTLVCLQGMSAANSDVQPLDSIVSSVKAAAISAANQQGYEEVSVNVQSLDNRLTLPQCEHPLDTFLPSASDIPGSLSVGVKCTGQRPWTIYVRANLHVRVSLPVLAAPLPRNSVIGQTDLQWLAVDFSSQAASNNLITDPSQIVGMETTRSVQANTPIRFSDLRYPKIIKRGQQVTLITSASNLEVRVKGKALGNAAYGDRVLVQNLSSGNTVEGIANKDGSVHVQ